MIRSNGWVLAALVVALVSGVAVGPVRANPPLSLLGGEATLAPMLEAATPAVVNIAVLSRTQVRNPLMQDPLFRRFFNVPDQPQERVRTSAGSGVIIDAVKGLVVSNHHVINGADEIVVTLKDRRRFKAKLVGSDAATDIALLRIDPDRLTALPIGDSDRLRVGDFVVAIGNPFGLGQTATSGIVSALGRSGLRIEGYEDFIQTDASINPGNSGGALVNLRGELIGINTAIIGPNGANVGIGFAVPTSMVKAVIEQLAEHGEVRRGRLGVAIQDLTPDLAEGLDSELARNGMEGAVVVKVDPGSPAEAAGLYPGDVVTALDGKPIHSSSDLRNRIGQTPVGTTVRLTVLRKGETRAFSARISR